MAWFSNDIKLAEELSKIRRYCKRCGHSRHVPKYLGKVNCDYCGYPIFYDEKAKFQFEIKKRLRNANNGRTISKNT